MAESITPNSRNNENKIRVAVELFHEGHHTQQHPADSGPQQKQSYNFIKRLYLSEYLSVRIFQMVLTGIARSDPIFYNELLYITSFKSASNYHDFALFTCNHVKFA